MNLSDEWPPVPSLIQISMETILATLRQALIWCMISSKSFGKTSSRLACVYISKPASSQAATI